MTWTSAMRYLFSNEDDDPVKLFSLLPKNNINQTTICGSSLLHIAVLYNRPRIIMNLINEGININSINEDDESVLHWAVHKGHYNLCELLLQNDADPNLKDIDDLTPLDWAKNENHEEIILLLEETMNET